MSFTFEQARELALSWPETYEQDHHGIASFRVRGKIFATAPDEGHLRVMAGEAEIRAAVAEHPGCCEPFYWGSRLACVVVSLEQAADGGLVSGLLGEAWLSKAPKSLADSVLKTLSRPPED
jgi:hypothetical protein